MKEAVGYTPAAAEGEGDAVAREVDLGDVVNMMISGVQPATLRSRGGMRLQSLSFFALESTARTALS